MGLGPAVVATVALWSRGFSLGGPIPGADTPIARLPSAIYSVQSEEIVAVLGPILLVLAVPCFAFWLYSRVRARRPQIRIDLQGLWLYSLPVIGWESVTGAWIQEKIDRDGRIHRTLVVEARGLDQSGAPGQGLGTKKLSLDDLVTPPPLSRTVDPDEVLAAIGDGFSRFHGRPLKARRMHRIFENN